MKNIYSNFRKLVPVAIIAIALTMLASCSSSNQFASSFSKRKYMAGHYSDPIAKVKVESRNAVTIAAGDNKKEVNSNSISTNKEDGKIAEPSIVAEQKPDNSKADKPTHASKTSLQHNLANKLAVPAVDEKNINTIEESSAIYASPNSLENTTSDNGGHHHYFLYFILALLLMILFLILAAGSALGGSGGGALLFVLLYYIAGIAALVFLILWILSLAQ